jgi:hypothetical protein
VQKLEEALFSKHCTPEIGSDEFACHLGLQTSEVIVNKSRVLGGSHWMATTREV